MMNSFMSQSATADSFHMGGSTMSPSFNGNSANEQRLTIGGFRLLKEVEGYICWDVKI